MEDRFGHRISYLRISITDRCNERCLYCLPEEKQEWLPRDGILTYEEIIRIVSLGAEMGIKRVRVTGGEPLTRRGIVDFFRMLHAVPGIAETALSTNGTLLDQPARGASEGSPSVAAALAELGVHSVNISIDTMDPVAYAATAGRDYLPRVLAGIAAARSAGFPAVKLNAVLMKGKSEDSLWPLIDYAHASGCVLRFIELMPVSTNDVLTAANFLPCGIARRLIEEKCGPLLPCPEIRTAGPAVYYQIPGRDQRIGFIGAMTNLHFCESCNKLRLTSDGKLRPCLGSHMETDILTPLRAGADDAELRRIFSDTVDKKPKEHDFRDGKWEPGRKMIAIGG